MRRTIVAIVLAATAGAAGAGIASAQSAPTTPDPWMQGQIDWSHCKDQGHTDAQCRQILDGK